MAYIGPQFIPGLANHSLIILCYRMSHSAADAWQLPPAPAIFPMFLPCHRTKKAPRSGPPRGAFDGDWCLGYPRLLIINELALSTTDVSKLAR